MESSHLYIYTPGLLHKDEGHGPALKDAKKSYKSQFCISCACITPTKEHLLKKY